MLNAQQASDLLNDAIKTDPAAITSLFTARRVCNKGLADHPHIQVHSQKEDGPYFVSLIGIVNGMLVSAGSDELVAVMYDDNLNQNILGFKVVHKSEVGLA